MREVWKDIEGYEGIYQVSNLGNVKCNERVRSIRNNGRRVYPAKVMVAEKMELGYHRMGLSKNGKRVRIMVHVLVASHFISKPMGTMEVNHKDGNKANNCVENLEWVTKSENVKHAYRVLGRDPYTKKSRERADNTRA